MKQLIFLSLFIAFVTESNAQYHSWGNEPGNIKWQQIKTAKFQIIYPEGKDSIAQRCANLLEHVYYSASKSLNHEPKKISVVLHTHSTISNGSVAWAPKQIDFFDAAPQDQAAEDWLELLAIHEFRHVVQIDKLNQGLSEILYILLGEQAIGAIAGLFIPSWFLEGDAVVTETALTKAGRGRQADFSMGLRAQLMDKKRYSYAKAYFGSYKDYVPNHYAMGYVVVANAREKYGWQLWDATLQHVAHKPWTIMPFSRSLRLQTGLPKRKLYHEMFEKQSIEWKLLHDREIHKPFDTIKKNTENIYTNYTHPHSLSDNSFFYEKKGLHDASTLVICKEHKEKIIAHTSFKESNERIHSNGYQIVWAEANSHIRWELKNSSDIYIYSIESKKTKRIKTKGRMYAPAINNAGKLVIVSEIDKNTKYWLTIYDIETKRIIERIPSYGGLFIQNPSWHSSDTKIIYIGTSAQGKKLIEYDIPSKTYKEYTLPDAFNNTSHAIYWKDFILFSSDYSGIDNIYALNTEDENIFRITVSRFGAKFPSVYKNTLLFSDYTADGFVIGKLFLDPKTWHSIDVVRKPRHSLVQNLVLQENQDFSFSNMQDSIYKSKPYSKLLHAVNIHSWMPFYADIDNRSISDNSSGFQLLSQDKLGTTFASAGFQNNYNKGKKAGFVNITHTGLFPVLDFNFLQGTQTFEDIQEKDTLTLVYGLREMYGRISVPLNFSSRSYYRFLTPAIQIKQSEYVFQSISNPSYIDNYIPEFTVATVAHTIHFSNILASSQNYITPRFGQSIFAGFIHTPLQKSVEYNDYLFSIARLYFPGFKKPHSIELYGAFEWNLSSNDVFFQSQISYPRGYDFYPASSKEMISLQANYYFPIFYPDAALGSVFYLKRIRAQAFVDYAIANFKYSNATFGTDIYADMHVLHLPAPINLGVRVAYLPSLSLINTQLLFAINFTEL